MKILTCNAGSSSVKFSLFEAEREWLIAQAAIDWSAQPPSLTIRRDGRAAPPTALESRDQGKALAALLAGLRSGPSPALASLDEIVAVGHRVVHGGERYTAATRISPHVRRGIDDLGELAPLHNAASLEVIDAAQRVLPAASHIAVFDTAFHATLPPEARTYPLPHKWTSDWGVRRFGFHGLNHSYCAARAREMIPGRDERLIIAHLGSGASISAVRGGVCIDTSMGFTPLEGLMMGTRSGTVDPGILIHVLRHKGVSVDELDHALHHESGLLGVSGVSADLREVLAAAHDRHPRAALAVDIYVHRIRQTIGAMAATLGGLDALVLTAGVGERSALIRRRVCESLSHLGLELDQNANETCGLDEDIATDASRARVLVIAAREDLSIVREIRRLLQPTGANGALP